MELVNIVGLVLSSGSAVWLVVLEIRSRMSLGRRIFNRGVAENWAATWRRTLEMIIDSVEGTHARFGPDAESMETATKAAREGLEKAEAELREFTDPFREAGEVWGPLTQQALALLLLALGFLLQLIGSVGMFVASMPGKL